MNNPYLVQARRRLTIVKRRHTGRHHVSIYTTTGRYLGQVDCIRFGNWLAAPEGQPWRDGYCTEQDAIDAIIRASQRTAEGDAMQEQTQAQPQITSEQFRDWLFGNPVDEIERLEKEWREWRRQQDWEA